MGSQADRPKPTAALSAQGRHRFLADFKDATKAFCSERGVCGLSVTDIGSGEDDGSILFTVSTFAPNTKLASLIILVSDTFEYPLSHTWVCFTRDEDPPAFVINVIESVADAGPRLIRELIDRVLQSLARGLMCNPRENVSAQFEDHDDDASVTEEDCVNFHSEDYGQGVFGGNASVIDMSILRRDFDQCVAAGYRPELRCIGTSELVLSISLPTYKLVETISPRTLMAWDLRLVSTSQFVTLVITGIRGAYPMLEDRATVELATPNVSLAFRVGLTMDYKPSAEQCLEFARVHALKQKQPVSSSITAHWTSDQGNAGLGAQVGHSTEHDESFAFGLSTSLEALMNECFQSVLALRVKHGFGWAAAETLLSKIRRLHRNEEDVMNEFAMDIFAADDEENRLSCGSDLPLDPLSKRENRHLNLPLLAYSYLLRRLMHCPRFCLVCHDKIEAGSQALKPYVCSDKLCTYQYYNLNRGSSLEYEICSRPQIVNLLVSLTYVAASEGGLHDFPDGMHLVVPDLRVEYPVPHSRIPYKLMQMCDFDTLDEDTKRLTIKRLIDTLPRVLCMKQHLQKRVEAGVAQPKLQDLDPDVLPAAWSILRWCVASCTAHIEELTDPADRVTGLDPKCRQFRFVVGPPDAEAKFRAEQDKARLGSTKAMKYPSLYGWHGSPAKNWHSIIRHGLWYKDVARGRAYGDGVYFSRNGGYSAEVFAKKSISVWSKSSIQVRSCFVLAEIVNMPSKFISHKPHYVVPQTDWIACRYLMVQGNISPRNATEAQPDVDVPRVALDPKNKLTGTTIPARAVTIPDPSHKLARLLAAQRSVFKEVENDEEDAAIFSEYPVLGA